MAKDLGTKIGSAFVDVGFAISGFGATFGSDITSAVLSQTFIVGKSLESFGKAVFARFSLPLIAATTANIAQFQALDREIRTTLTLFGTAPRLVDDTFSTMATGIRDVSESVGGLERDIADGLYQAISAGVPRGGVFDFLAVAQMAAMADRTADITTAVDGLTTVVNAFGLSSIDAERAADVMFATVALGKTTFGELSTDIGRVAPLAANAGVAFEELFAIIGALTLQGLKTSESISFMRAAITGLLRPTDELNAVFEAAGLKTAELAVPIIGLQSAFQLVVDAVGGSTSKLQELIGTSEGVSAILGVTGANAEKFAKGMNAVDNAAGSVARAFGIMNDAVGRTFGRLTEAFDRLGSTFGEMAARFAVPVFEKVTDVINNLVHIFEQLRPIAEGLSIVFTTLFAVFDIPVVEGLVTVFAALVITIFGLIGGLGLFAKTIGAVILAGLKLHTVVFVLGKLKGAFVATNIAAGAFGKKIAASSIATKALTGPMGLLGKATRGLGNSFSKLALKIPLATFAVFAVVAVIGLALIAFGKYIKSQREIAEASDTFGKGLDKLAESLGVQRRAFDDWADGVDEGILNITDFELANLDLLNRLREVNEELGAIAAADLAEAFLISLEFTDKENFDAAVLAFETLLNLDIDLDFSSLEDATAITKELTEGVLVAFESLKAAKGNKEAARQAATLGIAITDLLIATRNSGDIEEFDSLLAMMGRELNALDIGKLHALAAGIREAVEAPVAEGGLGIDITEGPGVFGRVSQLLTREGDLVRRLIQDGLSFDIPITIIPDIDISAQRPDFGERDIDVFGRSDAGQAALDQLNEAHVLAAQFGVTVGEAFTLDDEKLDSFTTAVGGIEKAFDDAKASVDEAFDAIATGLAAQNPLLDVYQGAVEQTFEEWQAGQELFRSDLEAVTRVRDELVGSVAPALLDAFDRAPIEKQAWLAALGEDDLALALEELRDTFNLIDENVKKRQRQSFTDIIEDGKTILTAGFIEFEPIAMEGGDILATGFRDEFDTLSAQWVTVAQNRMSEIAAVLAGPISPDVSAFDLGPIGRGTVNQTIINIYNTNTTDLTRDLDRANLVSATSGLQR